MRSQQQLTAQHRLGFAHPVGVLRRGRSRIGDSCGCAMGARFMLVALLLSGAYYAWQLSAHDVSLRGMLSRVALITFLAAGAGKFIGILRHRRR
jgi:hypothetical protein